MDKKRELLSFCSLALGIFVLFAVFRLPCLIVFLTGCPCPGCGMTRALIQALCFNFERAFYFHPLWPCIPVFGGIYLWAYLKDREKVKTVIAVVFASALAVTYVVRLFAGPADIMAFDFEKGMIYRAFAFLKKIFISW